MKRDHSYRNKLSVEKIDRDKETMDKNKKGLGASAFAIGIGALGAITLGGMVFSAMSGGVDMSPISYLAVKFQGEGFLLSSGAMAAGIAAAINSIRNSYSIHKKNKQENEQKGHGEGRSK